MHRYGGFMRPLAVLALCLGLVSHARAELTCEQLVASARAGLDLRDQGMSLTQVLAETAKPAMRERFQPDELGMIRQAVRLTFTGEVSLHELAETCAANKSGNANR